MLLDGRNSIAKLSDPTSGNERLIRYDLRTGATTELAPHRTSRAPVFIMDLGRSGTTILWLETPEPDMDALPWESYALDLGSGRESHLASYR